MPACWVQNSPPLSPSHTLSLCVSLSHTHTHMHTQGSAFVQSHILNHLPQGRRFTLWLSFRYTIRALHYSLYTYKPLIFDLVDSKMDTVERKEKLVYEIILVVSQKFQMHIYSVATDSFQTHKTYCNKHKHNKNYSHQHVTLYSVPTWCIFFGWAPLGS